ncbi:MAG: hypothetical protein ABI155_12790 [Paralcaligenes sp.]
MKTDTQPRHAQSLDYRVCIDTDVIDGHTYYLHRSHAGCIAHDDSLDKNQWLF